jgi:hypothetical protein
MYGSKWQWVHYFSQKFPRTSNTKIEKRDIYQLATQKNHNSPFNENLCKAERGSSTELKAVTTNLLRKET